MIELLYGRHRGIGAAARAEQHRERGNSHSPCHGDEQCRLVLAVAITRFDDLRRQARQVAADPQRQRDVAEVLSDPAIHRAQRVIQCRGFADALAELCFQRGRQLIASGGEIGVPVRHRGPGDRRPDIHANVERVGRRSERLGFDFLHVLRCPRVDAPAVRFRGLAFEADVLFTDARCDGRRDIDDEP